MNKNSLLETMIVHMNVCPKFYANSAKSGDELVLKYKNTKETTTTTKKVRLLMNRRAVSWVSINVVD